MIFKVENLGAIQHAEIDLSKDLILFCGHNNTGKTYLINAIYHLLFAEFRKLDFNNAVNTQYNGQRAKSIDIIEFVDAYENLDSILQELVDACLVEFTEFLGGIGKAQQPKFSLIIPDDERHRKLLAMSFNVQFQHSHYGRTHKYEKKPSSRKITFDEEETINCVILGSAIFPIMLRSSCMFFPVERNLSIFSKELSLYKAKFFEKLLGGGHDQTDLLDLANRRVNRYSKSIRDYLGMIEDLANLAKNTSEFNKLAEELETEILGGKIHISQYGDLSYQPSSAQNIALGMELSSSTVGSLSSLVFYLRHLARKGDTLIIDEPELSLHPDNQRLIARFFGRLINAGFKLIVSTHSDYIVREINNLIMLSKKSRKTAGLRKKYGYTQAQVLQPQQVGAYLFKRGEPSPISIEVGETGLEISTIDEVVADLNQSSQDIYFSLFD